MKKIKTSVLFLFFFCTLQAQDIARFQFNHISTSNGLSSNYARKIVEDPFGFIWIATQDGLNRYDGVGFVQYNNFSISHRTISGSDIRDLLVDTLNTLIWVLNSYGGFDGISYQTGKVEYSFKQRSDSLLPKILLNAFLLHNNQLIIGSSKGLYVFDIKTRNFFRKQIASQKPIEHAWVNKLLLDNSGKLWLFCNDEGIRIVDIKTWSQKYFIDQVKVLHDEYKTHIYFFDCTSINAGTVITGTNDGLKLFRLLNDELICDEDLPEHFSRFQTSRDVFVTNADNENNLWIATENAFCRIELKSGVMTDIRENSSWDVNEWIKSVYSFFIDRNQNLWIGCQQGILFSPNCVSAFNKFTRSADARFSLKQSYHIFPLDDSTYYCSSVNGFYKVSDRDFHIQALKKDDIFFYSFKDPNNSIWASAGSGTYLVGNDKMADIGNRYSEFARLGKFTINSHVVLNDSIIILGTESRQGIIVWNHLGKSIQVIDTDTHPLQLSEIFINNLFKDKNNNVWILFDNAIGIFDYQNFRITYINTRDKKTGLTYSIFFDACSLNNKYYVASYGYGVLELDSNYNLLRKISVDDGLSSNAVYKVLPYGDSILLITSDYGLSIIEMNKSKMKLYFASDGLHSDVFEERAGAVFKNFIFAGGANGFTRIDMSLLRETVKAPEFYFSNLLVRKSKGPNTDTSDLLLKSFNVSNDWLQFTIGLSALKFNNQNRLQFQYRLIEKDSGWIDNGNYSFISLTGLAPGTYNFQARVSDENGIWSLPRSLSVVIKPKWFETSWFAALIAMGIIAMIYGFYRYRLYQNHTEQTRIHKVRESIASDLHDDIGSTLNSIKIFTHVAEQSAEKQKYFDLIKVSLRHATEGLRDMIWVLDDQDDSVNELVNRIKFLMRPMAESKGISIEFRIDSFVDMPLNKTEKRNLLMITKEAINNCIKYSNCSKILIDASRINGTTNLSISDNGDGFDENEIKAGNGLKNIRNRAKQIGYFVKIQSEMGTGTTVLLISTR